MRVGMRQNVKTLSPTEEVVWWMMDNNQHHYTTIYYAEDVAKKHRLEFEEFSKKVRSSTL